MKLGTFGKVGHGWLRVGGYLSFLLCLIMLGSPELMAQETDEEETSFPLESFYAKIKNRPRTILKNIKFSFSTGYGNTFVSNPLDGFGIYQESGLAPQVFQVGTDPAVRRYTEWLTDFKSTSGALAPAAFLVAGDTTKLGFRGSASNIPFKLTVHYEWQEKYRIGLGYSYEFMSIGSLSPISYGDRIGTYTPANPSGSVTRFFGILGVSFYRAGNWLFTGDLQIGTYTPGSNFNTSLVQTGAYYNLGVTIERELSEYLKVFVRPSFEMKSYQLTPPEGGVALSNYLNAAYVNIGVSYSIPEFPKCYNKDCKIQMNHAHGDKAYRSRVHPIYKRQNPQYGENHPNLIKYKRKNRKKLNPY